VAQKEQQPAIQKTFKCLKIEKCGYCFHHGRFEVAVGDKLNAVMGHKAHPAPALISFFKQYGISLNFIF